MDNYGDHQVRACLRGRSIRRRINHPDRLNYPMKRVGKRGEGKFERISWEALDTIAGNLQRVVKDYGNEAVYINYSSGIVGGNITRSSPSASPVARLMNCYGGSLNQYGTYSTADCLRHALHLRQQRRQQHLGYRKQQTGGDVRQQPGGNPHERRRHYLVSGAGPRTLQRADDRYRPALYRYCRRAGR
jgi:anaerobic selenocysteine-containing dehydrogenase